MGVITEADTAIEDAFEYIEKAITKLDYATNKNTWGSNEYKAEYTEKLIDLSYELKKKLIQLRR